jgi:hypothetical protein
VPPDPHAVLRSSSSAYVAAMSIIVTAPTPLRNRTFG